MAMASSNLLSPDRDGDVPEGETALRRSSEAFDSSIPVDMRISVPFPEFQRPHGSQPGGKDGSLKLWRVDAPHLRPRDCNDKLARTSLPGSRASSNLHLRLELGGASRSTSHTSFLRCFRLSKEPVRQGGIADENGTHSSLVRLEDRKASKDCWNVFIWVMILQSDWPLRESSRRFQANKFGLGRRTHLRRLPVGRAIVRISCRAAAIHMTGVL